MSLARVWTKSITVAAHTQQEAMVKEGSLQSEELCRLLETVTQGEAPSRARQFAQRMRDTADEELVAPLETLVAAAHREPDLAEELDRADEAAEAEVDEETPISRAATTTAESPRRSGAPTFGEFWRALRNSRCRRGVRRAKRRVRSTTDAENEAGRNVTVSVRFAALTRWKCGIRWTEKIQS